MDAVSARIRELRVEANMRQGDLSEHIGVSQNMISNYENGREPPYDVLLSYMKFFDVSADYLLGVTDERKPPQSGLTEQISRLQRYAKEHDAQRTLSSHDMAALLEALAVHYKVKGKDANPQMMTLSSFVENYTNIVKACTADDTMALIESVNAMGFTLLNVNRILTNYIETEANKDR